MFHLHVQYAAATDTFQVTWSAGGQLWNGPVVRRSRLLSTLTQIQELRLQAWQNQGGTDRDDQRLQRLAGSLTTQLLGPDLQRMLAQVPSGSSLPILADAVGQQIPWELLQIQGEWLCERFALGRIWPDSVPPRYPRPGRWQTVVVPDAEARWVAIDQHHLRLMLGALSDQHPQEFQRELRLTPPATREQFWQVLPESRWLHFGGHTVLQEGQRVLRFAGDDLVTPQDILAAAISTWPEFIMLQACASATVDPQGISLAEAFCRRGVQILVGTSAPVLDQQSQRFTRPFYDALLGGVSVGEALRQTRLELKRELPPGNLLWLSYVLYGDPKMQLVPGSSRSMPEVPTPVRAIPCLCEQCGRAIETRHGVGQHTATGTLCRPCRQASTKRSLPDTSGGSHMDLEQQRRLFLGVWEQQVAQFTSIDDLDRAGKIGVVLKPQTYPAQASASHTRKDNWREALPGHNPTLMRRLSVHASGTQSHQTSIELWDCESREVDELKAWLLGTTEKQQAANRILVLVSFSGWGNSPIQVFTGSENAPFRLPGISVVLLDGRNWQMWSRTNDLVLHPFLPLLSKGDHEGQLQSLVDALEAQLPMESSLSAREFSMQHQVRLEVAETAMKLAALRFNLQLDSIPQHGLVISERSDESPPPLPSNVPHTATPSTPSFWVTGKWALIYVIVCEIVWGLVGLFAYLNTQRP